MPELSKKTNKMFKKQDLRKASCSPNNLPSRKQPRKTENPIRIPTTPKQSLDFRSSSSQICRNFACRAVLSLEDKFCKRCSCCICHLSDDQRDPSLWLVCAIESGEGDSCGVSCHIECALQHQKVGVVDLGQLMQLDGSYCCASCGKVSGILGCWKKQLVSARDARHIDALCYRICLSYRLLEGTSKFKELHEIVKDAKTKLETELGPVNRISAKMTHGNVSSLTSAGAVQKLCSLAIEKADEWMATIPNMNLPCTEDSLPAACKFIFEEVTSSSIMMIVVELSPSDDIKGYKLWYSKSIKDSLQEPVSIFPRTQRRILISNLQPCTEYSLRIISFTEKGDFGQSDAKCSTKTLKKVNKNPSSAGTFTCKTESGPLFGSSYGFKVRDIGKILPPSWTREQGCHNGFCSSHIGNCCGSVSKGVKPETLEAHLIDLNVISVPDLNEEITPPFESPREDKDNKYTLQKAVNKKDGLARSHGSLDSQTMTCMPHGEVSAVDSQIPGGKRAVASSNEETHDCDSTLINGSPFRISDDPCFSDESFEYCVKIFRWLECKGHIKQDFRLKLLTWFSLRSTEQDRRVVNTFIQTLIEDPTSLAGQLVDSFSDVISCKKPRLGSCSKLCH